ncbi:MAG TPA: enoyl-CoA hydratase-related protein [Thermoanaerobaculia bacterium]|nr:enoyl-CoA hydratase-related protein [Thermoanaerobaculia bacterium]
MGFATITLNRPEKLNAFAGTMREELIAALDRARDEPGVRCVVITGAGRAFCAGGDVEAMSRMRREGDLDGFMRLLDAGARIVTAIREMPKLVLASINGVAAGAGCNLALAADVRIASSEATLVESFVRIGLHPDWGGTYFLPRLVGTSRAIELMATGRVVGAAEALEIGMVDRVVEPGRLSAETTELARAVASGPPGAIADLKRAVLAAEGGRLAEQLELEKEHQRRAFNSADAAEGIAAFLEKRPPRFDGR